MTINACRSNHQARLHHRHAMNRFEVAANQLLLVKTIGVGLL
jgi:hypothetical protein